MSSKLTTNDPPFLPPPMDVKEKLRAMELNHQMLQSLYKTEMEEMKYQVSILKIFTYFNFGIILVFVFYRLVAR